MKFSLRKSILAIAALALAGSAMAATPALTKVWSYSGEGIPANGMARFGTGYGEKVYTYDRSTGNVLEISATGVKTITTLEGVGGVAITSDDAGNLLISKALGTAQAFTDWVIVEPNGTTHDLTLAVPDGGQWAEATGNGRVDQAGRVAGNLLSEDGAWLFLTPQGSTAVSAIKIVNGEQDADASLASPTVTVAMNSSTIAQPMFYTVDDIEASVDPSTAFYSRNRSNHKIYGWEEDGSAQTDLGALGLGGCEGFDVFTLDGELYGVARQTSSAARKGTFVIRNITKSEDVLTAGMDDKDVYFYGSYVVRPISETMFGIYVFNPGVGAEYYTYGYEEAPESKLYVIGEINGKSWAPNDGVEMTLADGAFSADITVSGAAGFFSFVTDLAENNDQGGWDYVNELRYGAANDGDVASTEAANALVKGSNAYQLPTGEYTLSVKEDLSEFTVTVKGEPVPTYPDELYILGEVNENTWAPNVGLMMTPADSKSLTGEFIATFKADGRNDGYNFLSFSSKLAENADDWAAIAGSRYGAEENNKEVVLDEAMAIQKGENAYKIAAGEYNVEVNLSAGTVKFSAVPVVGPSAPVINPNGGTFENEVTVTITAEEADEIRYTLDGSTPDATSTLYAEPIVLNEVGTHTVKAIALKNGLVSDAVEAEFTITDGGSGEDAKLEVILEKKDDIVASSEGRFSTGYGDYLYTTNKADGQIVRYDKTGARSVFASVEGIGVAITSDDAGNIIVNKGFPGASSATDWVIVEPDGTQHDLAITFPEAVAAARIDVAGRVIGNVMSEEGAWMFLAAQKATKLVAVRIANGAQDGDALDSPAAQYELDNTTVARARYESVEEVDAATDPSTAVVYRKRGNLNIYGWDEDGAEIVNFGQPEGARSCEGFDIFKIGDVYYSVEPSTDTNYADGFAIRELGKTENIVTKEKVLFAGGSQRFQSLTARVTGGCAIIYQNVSGEGIGMYKFTPAGTGVNTIAAEGEVVATAYYNLQGVRVNNPAAGQILIKVNTLSNGKVSASKVLVR